MFLLTITSGKRILTKCLIAVVFLWGKI